MSIVMTYKTQWIFLVLVVIALQADVFAQTRLRCEKDFPTKLQVDALTSCNQETFSNKLQPGMSTFDATITHLIMRHNNMGGSVINFPNHSKVVYRSANLAGSPLCLQELHQIRKVNTIINLSTSIIGHQSQQTLLEESLFESLGGDAYVQIFNIKFNPQTKITKAYYHNVAKVIHYINDAQGNVLIHCVIGGHSAGVVFGVMQKCYNKIPIDLIKKSTMCHLGQPQTPYLHDMSNLAIKIIEDYPCEIL